ncbi:MAG: hypothetical protein HY537_03195 [Deltaproteobacteria bacterium]|nr:hypothetical protein [Deltaproteobacteria bacterium]
MRARILKKDKIALSLFLLSFAAIAAPPATLHDIVSSYELHALHKNLLCLQPLVILADRQSPTEFSGQDALWAAIIKEKLTRSEISSRIGRSDLFSDFDHLRAEEVLAPKLIIVIRIERKQERYFLQSRLVFLRYLPKADEPGWLIPTSEWTKELVLADLLTNELTERMAQFVRKEIESFILFFRNLRAKEGTKSCNAHRIERAELGFRKVQLPEKSTLQEHPSLPDPFQVGVAVGTPAIGNIHLGLWAGGKVPVAGNLSGMVWNARYRGFQADVGWAFKRGSGWRHAAGLGVAGFNDTRESIQPVLDGTGNVIAQEKTTVDSIKFFIGPVYTLVWKSIRLQGGVSYRMGEGAGSNVRWLFQIGFSPFLHLSL